MTKGRIRTALERLWRRFRESDFARAVATLAGGTAAGQLLTVVASPVLTRLFTPEEFGLLAVYTSILGITAVTASARYELAIPLPESDEDGIQLLAISVASPLFVAGLVALAAVAAGRPLLELINAGGIVAYVWLIPMGIVGAATYEALSYWAIRRKAFGPIARTKITRSGAQAVTQVGLGAWVAGPLGLLVGHFVGQVGGSGSLFRALWRRDRALLKDIRLRRMWAMAKRYRRFPIFSTGSALLNRAGLLLPSLLLIGFYGPQVAGWFSLGQKVLAVPLRLVGRSVSQVYLGEAAEIAQDSVRRLHGLFGRTSARLLAIGAVPALILAVAGPWLFRLVFGAGWTEAGVYARLLAVMFLVQFAVTPVSQTLNVIERQDLQLWWDAGRTSLTVASLVFVPMLGGNARLAIGSYAGAMAVAYIALYLVSRYALCEETKRASGPAFDGNGSTGSFADEGNDAETSIRPGDDP